MRNKFTELVAQGVAEFSHTPIASDVPQQSQLCRDYNNIWGIITDTHMSMVEGRPVITGTFVSDERKWMNLHYQDHWGGVQFYTTGYCSLSDFLYKHGLIPNRIVLNGQPAIELIENPIKQEKCPCADVCCGSYCTTESAFPQRIEHIMNVQALQDCLSKPTLNECVLAMNESYQIPGTHWHIFENNIVGRIGNQNVILETKFDLAEQVDYNELSAALDQEGLGELYLRKFPNYFIVDSDDQKWRRLLRGSRYNKIQARSLNELTIEDWIFNIKNIVNSIS